MQIEHEGSTYNVHLVDDGTLDTVISVSNREFRFNDVDPDYRDADGCLTEEGFEALAIEAIEELLSDIEWDAHWAMEDAKL